MRKTLILITALVFAAFAPAVAQDETPAQRDDIVATDVRNVIGNNVHYTVYDIINVGVKDGEVVLDGFVTDPYKIDSFKKDIKDSLDVESITSNIEVLPVNQNDRRLRYLIARKIYGDSSLLRYSLSKWPYPIHIIVKNGRVTLEGQVGTKLDHRLIESKVRNTFGVLKVNNNLDIA